MGEHQRELGVEMKSTIKGIAAALLMAALGLIGAMLVTWYERSKRFEIKR